MATYHRRETRYDPPAGSGRVRAFPGTHQDYGELSETSLPGGGLLVAGGHVDPGHQSLEDGQGVHVYDAKGANGWSEAPQMDVNRSSRASPLPRREM